MTAIYCRSVAFLGWMVCGIFLFTFAEYWVHRLALHGFYYHDRHERHHDHPKEYVVFPVWFTPMVFLAFWLVFPVPVFVGLVLGYCWFIYWHHILHHIDNLMYYPVFIQKYAVWHLKHHNDETVNFGITMNVWDWLFRTYR